MASETPKLIELPEVSPEKANFVQSQIVNRQSSIVNRKS